jgi:hypothetical protein
MKPSKSQLYTAMGELVYAVAKSKGLSLQPDSALFLNLFADQAWSQDVLWSMFYEHEKNKTLDEAYTKAIDICKAYGPAEEYHYLIMALKELSLADDKQENDIIVRFQEDLTSHFMAMENI